MSVAWGLQKTTSARELGQDRFLMELESEQSFRYVTEGGPWRHNGEAFIVVPYDGVGKALEVPINYIAPWVHIFDLPEFMMNEEYGKSFGGKLGEVKEYGGAVWNFLRVRVDYPLQKAHKPCLKIRIEGRVMTFSLKYENVPNFRFFCGEMGHDENNCDHEDLREQGRRFNTELRASPLKCRHSAQFSIPADRPRAARNLNFASSQKKQPRSAASSSRPQTTNDRNGSTASGKLGNTMMGSMQDKSPSVPDNEEVYVNVAKELSDALETSVHDMRVEDTNKEGELAGSGSEIDTRNVCISFSGDYHLSGSSQSLVPSDGRTKQLNAVESFKSERTM